MRTQKKKRNSFARGNYIETAKGNYTPHIIIIIIYIGCTTWYTV